MARRNETEYVILASWPSAGYAALKLEVIGPSRGYTPEQARRRAVNEYPQIRERAREQGQTLLFAVPAKSFAGVPVKVTEVDRVTLGA